MLRTSTKNVAYEVISCLIDSNGKGVLTEIIKWLTTSDQNLLNDNESILDHLSKRKDAVAVESEEEPESYVRGPVGVGDNMSTNSTGSSGSMRIKIRKNSVDPHSKIKANMK